MMSNRCFFAASASTLCADDIIMAETAMSVVGVLVLPKVNDFTIYVLIDYPTHAIYMWHHDYRPSNQNHIIFLFFKL